MEIIETKCCCLDGDCERKYIEVNNVIDYQTKVIAICRSLISSRIQKYNYKHKVNKFTYDIVSTVYRELIIEHIPHFVKFNFEGYRRVYGTMNDLMNHTITLDVSERPCIYAYMSISEFINLCFDYPKLMYTNHNNFYTVCKEYFDTSYFQIKKYKTQYSKLNTIVKSMSCQMGTTLELTINELMSELLLLQSKVKKYKS